MSPFAQPATSAPAPGSTRTGFLALATALLLGAGPAAAIEAPFALAFPVKAPEGEPLFVVEVPAEAYATLRTTGFADLAVVDANGQAQTIGVMPPPPPTVVPPTAIPLALPIALPRPSPDAGGRLELHVERGRLGQVQTLDLRSAWPSADAGPAGEWLVDTGDAARPGYDAIRLGLADAAGDFRSIVDVLGSDDLVTWTPIAVDLPLLRASDGSQRIERLDLAFPRSTFRYLLLRPRAGGAALPALASLQALRDGRAEGPAPRTIVLPPGESSEDGRRFEFDGPGALPVRSIDVQLPEAGGIRGFQLSMAQKDRWLPVASGVAWHLDIDGTPLRSPPLPLASELGHRLRLDFTQPGPPPRLALTYRPDRLVVVASGQPPFRLLAGSATYRGAHSEVESLLAAVRDRQGESWQPPLAEVGPGSTLSGEAALEAPVDLGRVALWLILGLGALAVGGMAWRLLRDGGPASPVA